MPTTTARNYYERFTADAAVALLQSLPSASPKEFENEWLDFKSGRAGENLDKLEKLWSTAVGAFSNNEGGVIVFGIDARPDATTGIDAANAVALVPDVNWLVSKLTELSRFATDPPPAGIEYAALPLTKGGKEGFVVCLIPEAKVKPCRSEKADRRFYLRMGDSAREPTVSLLRQLFYPQFKTKALLKMKVMNGNGRFHEHILNPAEGNILFVECQLINTGTFTIEFAVIEVTSDALTVLIDRQMDRIDAYDPKELPDYFHPSQVKKFAFYLQRNRLPFISNANVFTVSLYQRNATALTKKFRVDIPDASFEVGATNPTILDKTFASGEEE